MRRLHVRDGMSLAEIDKTGILPPSRVTNESGLLWSLSQRYRDIFFSPVELT